jgi:hypothetical protein
MTPTQMAITLPLATISTLLFVVACGPTQGDYVPVAVRGGMGKVQVFDACTKNLKGTTVMAGAKGSTVQVCVFKGADATGKKIYEEQPRRVKYKISRNDDTITLGLDAHYQIPSGLSDNQIATVTNVLTTCSAMIAPHISGAASRSSVKIVSSIIKPTVVEGDPTIDSPAIVNVKLVNVGGSALVLSDWPDSPELYMSLPNGQSSQCDPRDKDPKSDCVQGEILAANLPFCQTLARMAGHWLGLTNPDDARCTIDTASTNVSAGGIGFMKAAARETPERFFEDAALSLEEQKAVLAPACNASGTPGL